MLLYIWKVTCCCYCIKFKRFVSVLHHVFNTSNCCATLKIQNLGSIPIKHKHEQRIIGVHPAEDDFHLLRWIEQPKCKSSQVKVPVTFSLWDNAGTIKLESVMDNCNIASYGNVFVLSGVSC